MKIRKLIACVALSALLCAQALPGMSVKASETAVGGEVSSQATAQTEITSESSASELSSAVENESSPPLSAVQAEKPKAAAAAPKAGTVQITDITELEPYFPMPFSVRLCLTPCVTDRTGPRGRTF